MENYLSIGPIIPTDISEISVILHDENFSPQVPPSKNPFLENRAITKVLKIDGVALPDSPATVVRKNIDKFDWNTVNFQLKPVHIIFSSNL